MTDQHEREDHDLLIRLEGGDEQPLAEPGASADAPPPSADT